MPAETHVVVCFSGHDPGGGAGLQADIEAISAQGVHAAGVITAHTVQDTRNVMHCLPADAKLFRGQLACLLADVRVHAIKIGLLGEASQIPVIADAIRRCAVPTVLDPVLRAGGGADLASPDLIGRMRTELLPQVDLITPNADEARRLAPKAGSLDACAQSLIEAGAKNVLITGGDEAGEEVTNTWWAAGNAPRTFRWPRLAGPFHGAGCTLAAASAALLARGLPMADALERAQAYTHRALSRAVAIGHGRLIPRRYP